MTQRARAVGFVRDLRARGITFDARGRARRGGKYITDRALAVAITKLRGGETVVRAPTTLDVQLERWGVPEEARRGVTPSRLARIANVSKRKASEWIARDGAPKETIDRIASRLINIKAYPETWKHGKRAKATREEEKQLRRAFRDFVRARTLNNPRAHKFYDKWKRIKDYLRARLTKKAWRALVEKLGRAEGIQKQGLFSVMRFILS